MARVSPVPRGPTLSVPVLTVQSKFVALHENSKNRLMGGLARSENALMVCQSEPDVIIVMNESERRKGPADVRSFEFSLRPMARKAFSYVAERGGSRPLGRALSTWARVSGKRTAYRYEDGRWYSDFGSVVYVDSWPKLRGNPDLIRRTVLATWCSNYRPNPGDTVVDVGAGIGTDSQVFSSLVGPGGHVYSYEANPRVCSFMRDMVRASGIDNITIRNKAVAAARGILEIQDGEDHLRNSVTVSSGPKVVVEAVTLDDDLLAHGVSVVDFLKMNIEGAELDALAGMKKMLDSTLRVCVSCHDFVADRTGAEVLRTKSRVVELLQDSGFSMELANGVRDKPWFRDQVHAVNRRSL